MTYAATRDLLQCACGSHRFVRLVSWTTNPGGCEAPLSDSQAEWALTVRCAFCECVYRWLADTGWSRVEHVGGGRIQHDLCGRIQHDLCVHEEF